MKKPSYVGEAAVVIVVIDFIYWAVGNSPSWVLPIGIIFGALFIIDWMMGGIADKGICKNCF